MPAKVSFAFQPIIDASTRRIVSYEALLRTRLRGPAAEVLGGLTGPEICELDQASRGLAMALAARHGIVTRLNLNVTPQGLCAAGAVGEILALSRHHGLAPDRIVLEVTESEAVTDHDGFADAVRELRAAGVHLAIDGFGAGYAGLNLLAEFQPDLIKLDMLLVRDIHTSGPRQAMVRAVSAACFDLGIDVLAEGVESVDEYGWFRSEGVCLFQGYLFGRPDFERFPAAYYPDELALSYA